MGPLPSMMARLRRRNRGRLPVLPQPSRLLPALRTSLIVGLTLVVAVMSVQLQQVSFSAAVHSSHRLADFTKLRATRAARAPAAVSNLPTQRSDVFIKCVEEYNPNGPHEFREGPPSTGFRNLTEAIRPYHPHPEWMIFPPGRSFELDQKMCSMYTLATGLFQQSNRALREDNEDSIRRHMGFIHELREVLKFKTSTICTPQGRKCRPFIGRALRGLTVPPEVVQKLADQYKVGTEFTWPAFTSCNFEEAGLWPFDGNLNFEIECNIDPKQMAVEEVYAPVRISRFMQGSSEVLFPPHTRFRVTGEKEMERVKEHDVKKDVYTKTLEVIDLPTPWHIEKYRH